MEEATLQAVKRAMPGHGRARIHEKLLSFLGIEDQTEVEVSTEAGKTLTLTVFADELVDEGIIRISGEDLNKLGIPDGGKVQVKRKIPLEEQVRKAAETAAGQVKEGTDELGAKLSETAEKLQKGATETADKIGVKAKEISDKVKEETKPISEKVGKAAKSSADAIREKIPIGKFSAEIEKGLSMLSPADAKKMREGMSGAEGICSASTVAFAAGRSIGNLTIPPKVTIVGVQRKDQLLDCTAETVLKEGDIAYLTGPSDEVGFVSRILEG